jgi:Bacterial Ig-like domain (group 3)
MFQTVKAQIILVILLITCLAQAEAKSTRPPSLKIDVTPGASEYEDVTIELPLHAESQTLSVWLNAKDVSSRFSVSRCESGICGKATLSDVDGLYRGKNVMFASAKTYDANSASGRLRFYSGTATTSNSAGQSNLGSYPTSSNFLPPTVAIKTIQAGGPTPGQSWIQVGSQLTISAPTDCTRYVVAVLDRSQLTWSSTSCYADGSSLAAYLKTLTVNQLVIVGTTQGSNTDASSGPANFDTSAIGGHMYNCAPTNGKSPAACTNTAATTADIPNGYVAIGAGGDAASGSAFENYYQSSDATQTSPSFNGILTEDPWGYFDYQPAGSAEFQIGPATQADGGGPSAYLSWTGIAGSATYFTPPSTNDIGGYWLIVLDRTTLIPVGLEGYTSTVINHVPSTVVDGIGMFYPTGATDPLAATNAFIALASDLKSVHRDQLVFLVTIGTPVYGTSATDAANLAQIEVPSPGGIGAYYNNFAPALESFGVPAMSTMYLYSSTDGFSMVSCTSCGEPLTGNVAVSTTRNAQQGQTGWMHGLLQQNLNGMYWPIKNTQLSPNENSVDYAFDEILNQSPIDWPEVTGTAMPGVSSAAAQQAAYHYLSYQLITQYYILGAKGNYLDDIHYYFTSSLVGNINYHTKKAGDLAFPGTSGTCYSWNDPVTQTELSCFNASDQQIVAQQMDNELVDAYNVYQFMAVGTPNIHDLVIGNSGSAVAALIAASATVSGSELQPPPSTSLTLNTSKLLSFVGNVINFASAAATGGLVPPDQVGSVRSSGRMLSAAFSGAANYLGFVKTPGHTFLPSPQYKLATTIGTLASDIVNNQESNFDTEFDSLLGDWGRLNALGPRITNSSDPDFFLQNQTQGEPIAIQMMGQASERTFFLDLLPTAYQIQYFPDWPNTYPDMGLSTGRSCTSWYQWKSAPANSYTYYPTYTGDFVPYNSYNPVQLNNYDVYILATPAKNAKSKTTQNFQMIDAQTATTLFGVGGNNLNMPIDQVMSRVGPLAPYFQDVTVKNFTNFSLSDISACSEWTPILGSGDADAVSTTTRIAVATVARQGENISLFATVTAKGRVPAGTVTFEDGTAKLGSARLDPAGIAIVRTNSLSEGRHRIVAAFTPADSSRFAASQSNPTVVVVSGGRRVSPSDY